MAPAPDVPLVLGGHSFITELGSDPPATPDEQLALVAACLDQGIRWFDTTYEPERLALGRALEQLGRRDEAVLIAWNFFGAFGPDGQGWHPREYRPDDIDAMLEQFRTDRIDRLVVHDVPDPAANVRQRDLARQWQARGFVEQLGIWHPGADAEAVFGPGNPFGFMVRPYNVTTADAAEAFAAARRLGWQTLACSPFVRGWELDKLVARAVEREGLAPVEARARLAEHMLRDSLCRPNVDRLIVAMRRPAYVAQNVQAARRGPLGEDERRWLASLTA